MRYIVLCYKLPISFDKFKIASQYMFIQSIKSYNAQNNIYELVESRISPTELYTFARIHTSHYPSVIIRKLLPKGCETSEQTSTVTWPVTRTVYFTPNRPSIGTSELMTSVHQVKLEGVPEYFEQYLNGNKYQLFDFDFSSGNIDSCFVYKLAKFEVNIFGGSLIERIAIRTLKNVFKTTYVNLINTREQWENLTEEDLPEIYKGDIVRAVTIEIEETQELGE
ncbi:Phosphatidylinositol_transfer protein [Hexamita inflata]|uniref:Phosphatidylinositol transfer protein n=1 Tax=Hexamita inflata TaxID=28002 RepID=A0AA86QT15_9EUKA|nr:Phosphatidylinositol transfer protein [Hexamita inflata]